MEQQHSMSMEQQSLSQPFTNAYIRYWCENSNRIFFSKWRVNFEQPVIVVASQQFSQLSMSMEQRSLSQPSTNDYIEYCWLYWCENSNRILCSRLPSTCRTGYLLHCKESDPQNGVSLQMLTSDIGAKIQIVFFVTDSPQHEERYIYFIAKKATSEIFLHCKESGLR